MGQAVLDLVGRQPNTQVGQGPVSRPQLQMLIGYDSSGTNKASFFGDAGALQSWAIDAPEKKTNWMIRVEYR